MRSVHKWLVAMLIGMMLLIAGCGGGGTPDPDSGGSPGRDPPGGGGLPGGGDPPAEPGSGDKSLTDQSDYKLDCLLDSWLVPDGARLDTARATISDRQGCVVSLYSAMTPDATGSFYTEAIKSHGYVLELQLPASGIGQVSGKDEQKGIYFSVSYQPDGANGTHVLINWRNETPDLAAHRLAHQLFHTPAAVPLTVAVESDLTDECQAITEFVPEGATITHTDSFRGDGQYSCDLILDVPASTHAVMEFYQKAVLAAGYKLDMAEMSWRETGELGGGLMIVREPQYVSLSFSGTAASAAAVIRWLGYED